MWPFSSSSSSSLLSRLVQGLLGLLGLYAAARLLPRLLKTLTRRFLFGLVGEIVLVALGLFLTRQATRSPARNGEPARSEDKASS